MLTCRKYVATQAGSGWLVLSEFAGAAVEWYGVALPNPHDPVALRDKLKTAIAMNPAERQERLRTFYNVERHNDISC
ncbi:trehalose-6-phosphate synthase [Azonexus sp.]|jgi:trehalose-6-phosphate synthase|uniref:trehalose-6-phosphate synthase n=1 Tax=Azonexus sp. TaxID=1872668 RepID=UPI00282B6451|nr:trehalose-6-phosphate synthase [Azonexus sp.]MDR1995244.1 trehalose-6-phosphate synthase [Azonexus sp.]